MKRIVFLIIASLLMIGLVLPGCAGGDGGEDTRPPIAFAIAGPMTEMPGKNHWWGAELARDEINAGAGVNVGGVYHKIELVQVDTNEYSGTAEEGVTALEAVIDDVDFVLGGWETEDVVAYREVAMDAHKIFMNCGTATGSLQYSVVSDYDRYKYWFKSIPYNETFLVKSLYKMTTTIGQVLKATLEEYGDTVAEDYRVPEDGKLRVAILAEDGAWCAGGVTSAEHYLPLFGFAVVGTWPVSATATDISTELSQIAATKPHIIFTWFRGPVSVVYSSQRVELGIPAMTIGVKLIEGQQKSHWANTDGKCNGEVILDTWAEGLQRSAKTTDFFNAFMARTGEYPLYTAGTYDAIYSLKEAIEAVSDAHDWDDIADVLDLDNIDALIRYLETSSYTGAAGTTRYYPMPAVTLNATAPGLYALSEAQVLSLYNLAGYNKTYVQSVWRCGYTGTSQYPDPHIAHDIVYGPGYQTGIGSQWQDGHKVGVWPIDLGDDYDAALTDQYGCWNFEYPGTTDVVIPIEGFLEHVIKIAVVEPMTDIQGQDQWDGATMAAEEINDAGGVDVSGRKYTVELVEVETKEATEGEDGSTGTANLEAVIDDVAFVVGGFRTQVVQVYREVAIDAQKIFMNCGAATGSLQFSVVTDYDKYKYWFKSTPYNETFLVKSCLKMTATIGGLLKGTLQAAEAANASSVKDEYKISNAVDGKLRVHIMMEDAAWCAGMVLAAQAYLPLLGYTVTGTTLVSPTAADITTEMNAIKALNPHMIFTSFSGSVGAVYSTTKADLGIPAMTIGINVRGQELSQWVNTNGACKGEIMLDTWAVGLQNTAKTTAFFNAFVAKTGRYPVYLAATYDAIHVVCKAIDETDSLDSDTLVTWLEDVDNAYTEGVSSPKLGFYQMPAIEITPGQLYALSEAQVSEWYDLDSYGKTYDQNQWLCGYVSGVQRPHIAHDIVYGPGLVTGVGSQWQEVEGAGAKVGVWPMDLGDAYDEALTDQYGCWNFEYPGTTDVLIPIEGFLAS